MLEDFRDQLVQVRKMGSLSYNLAAVAYAKAMRRRQIMVATSSIGPGRDEHGHRRGRRDGQPTPAVAVVR